MLLSVLELRLRIWYHLTHIDDDMALMTRQGDVATQDDMVFDDMAMEKYHFEDQELSLEELYLEMEISLDEQASNDLVETK